MEERRLIAVGGVSRNFVERRSEPRRIVSEDVMVTVPGWAGQPNPMPARIVNISGQGMCLHTDHPVQCGVHIEIATSRGVTIGEVCRCKSEIAGYSLGVRVAPTAA
jgi:hypothetical protein